MAQISANTGTILYNSPLSSYAQKIRIALREKNLPFETQNPPSLGDGEFSGPFYEANPRMEVPVLIDGDGPPIFDSTIIMEYLEEKYTDTPLMPSRSDAGARAQVRMIEEICDTTYEALNWAMGEVNWMGRAEGELADKLKLQAREQTKVMQKWLSSLLGDKDWFTANGDGAGSKFGWADICVAPILNRSGYYNMPPEKGSNLDKWLERCKQRESIRLTFEEFSSAAGGMYGLRDLFISGKRKREYRDHRLEWLIKSGGIDIVSEGLKNNNIRFSWPAPV